MYRNAVNGQPMHKKTVALKIEDNPGVWSTVSGTFTCRGGERFITIGSFEDDLQTADFLLAKKNPKNVRIFNYSKSAYNFIESIEVIKLNAGVACTPQMLPHDTEVPHEIEAVQVIIDTIKSESRFVLQNLNFELDKSELLSSSYAELDDLADHLNDQPDLILTIMGHTDNTGTLKKNLLLSQARAKAVADYLITRGVAKRRLKWKGFGQSYPIADNATETGRAVNRRVEFQLE